MNTGEPQGQEVPSLEEVCRILAKVPESLAEAVIAERRDRDEAEAPARGDAAELMREMLASRDNGGPTLGPGLTVKELIDEGRQ